MEPANRVIRRDRSGSDGFLRLRRERCPERVAEGISVVIVVQ